MGVWHTKVDKLKMEEGWGRGVMGVWHAKVDKLKMED